MNDFASHGSSFADMTGSGHRAKFTGGSVICQNLLAGNGSTDEQIVGPKPISIGAEVARVRDTFAINDPLLGDIRVYKSIFHHFIQGVSWFISFLADIYIIRSFESKVND